MYIKRTGIHFKAVTIVTVLRHKEHHTKALWERKGKDALSSGTRKLYKFLPLGKWPIAKPCKIAKKNWLFSGFKYVSPEPNQFSSPNPASDRKSNP